jgi:putative transposase
VYTVGMDKYNRGGHTVYRHGYHLVWITKYRYRVLTGETQRRARVIIIQVAEDMGVKIRTGVVSADHIHLHVSIPPHIAVSEFVKRAKGRSSRKIQQEFPHLRKTYWGRCFWGRGYFSVTSGNVTEEMIDAYINNHADRDRENKEEDIDLG